MGLYLVSHFGLILSHTLLSQVSNPMIAFLSLMISPLLFILTPFIISWNRFIRLVILFWQTIWSWMIPSTNFTSNWSRVRRLEHLIHWFHDHFNHGFSLMRLILSSLLSPFWGGTHRIYSRNGFILAIYVTIVIKINCIIYALILSFMHFGL